MQSMSALLGLQGLGRVDSAKQPRFVVTAPGGGRAERERMQETVGAALPCHGAGVEGEGLY